LVWEAEELLGGGGIEKRALVSSWLVLREGVLGDPAGGAGRLPPKLTVIVWPGFKL
jgi:hypothetical protein